jgi:hypothetical protein
LWRQTPAGGTTIDAIRQGGISATGGCTPATRLALPWRPGASRRFGQFPWSQRVCLNTNSGSHEVIYLSHNSPERTMSPSRKASSCCAQLQHHQGESGPFSSDRDGIGVSGYRQHAGGGVDGPDLTGAGFRYCPSWGRCQPESIAILGSHSARRGAMVVCVFAFGLHRDQCGSRPQRGQRQQEPGLQRRQRHLCLFAVRSECQHDWQWYRGHRDIDAGVQRKPEQIDSDFECRLVLAGRRKHRHFGNWRHCHGAGGRASRIVLSDVRAVLAGLRDIG